MIVRNIDDIRGTAQEVAAPNWVSRRLLLAKDGMGFSFHETTIFAGTETHIHYRNHLEAVFCVAGEGEGEAGQAVVPGRPLRRSSTPPRYDEHLVGRPSTRSRCHDRDAPTWQHSRTKTSSW